MSRTALLALLALAACGAEGAPQAPAGVTLHGTAKAGVVIQTAPK